MASTEHRNSVNSCAEDGGLISFDFDDKSIRRGFIKKVYSILMVQLLVTLSLIAIFVFTPSVRGWAVTNRWMIYVALLISLLCILMMALFVDLRRKPPHNYIFLGIFTLVKGFMLGIVCCHYYPQEVIMAIGITALVCLALTLFAFQTKWDFTMMGGMLFVSLIVLILFGLIAIILQSNLMRILYSALGVLIFSFYLIYDTQLMMGGEHKYTVSPEEYVFAALNLYLDIVNLFLHILNLYRR